MRPNIDEIEARAEAATEQETELDGKFGTFIHHYSQDIPALTAYVRELEAALASANAAFKALEIAEAAPECLRLKP